MSVAKQVDRQLKEIRDKKEFLRLYAVYKDENRAIRDLGHPEYYVRMWLRDDKAFANQFDEIRNGAKYKIIAAIFNKALKGCSTRVYNGDGDLVQEKKYNDPALIKLAYQIASSKDFDKIKNYVKVKSTPVFSSEDECDKYP